MKEQDYCEKHRCVRSLCDDSHLHSFATADRLELEDECRNVYPRAAGEHADCSHPLGLEDDGITADDTGYWDRIADDESHSELPQFNGPSVPGGDVPDSHEYYLMITRTPGTDPLVKEPKQ